MKFPVELVAILKDQGGTPMPAAELAHSLGVSTRSVRHYIAAINEEYGGVVRSSRAGYTLNTADYESALRRVRGNRPGTPRTPVERMTWILQTLIREGGPVDIYVLAEQLHVSESTIEADLTKARSLLDELDLRISRDHHLLAVEGEESGRRRLMRRFLTDAAAGRHQVIDIGELLGPAIRDFQGKLLKLLQGAGIEVNDRFADELVAHIVVMVERVRNGQSVHGDADPAIPGEMTAVARQLSELVNEEFGVELPSPELNYIVLLLIEKVAPREVPSVDLAQLPHFFEDRYVELVTRIARMVNDNYLIDLESKRFIAFLSLHVRNLVQRASDSRVAHLPAGQSVKHSHPLIHEIAVFIARQIELATGVEVAESEIGLIALHVGVRLQELYDRESRLTLTLFVPRYYDLHRGLERAVNEAVQGYGQIDDVVTTTAYDWSGFAGDAIVGTAPVPDASDMPVIRIPALPTPDDLERVRAEAKLIVGRKLRSRVASSLTNLFDPRLFIRGNRRLGRDEVIALLADALEAEGLVGADFLHRVHERERLSTTAFPSGAAIPHPMVMDAARSGIAVFVSSEPVDWDGQPVNLVAMLAFSSESRNSFGSVFDHFIHVLIDRRNVLDLVRVGSSYDGFIRGLMPLL